MVYKMLPELIVITSEQELSFREIKEAHRIIVIRNIDSGKYKFFYFKNRNGKTGIFFPTQDFIEELTELFI